MVTQNRRIGGRKHELLLRQTMWNLRERGCKVIDLGGKSPTMIGIKNNKVIAISNSYLTHAKLHDIYSMFDDVVRTDKTKDELLSEYDRIVELKKKSPDAIAVKDNKIYAIEILGTTRKKELDHIRNIKNWSWREKQQLYDMFDGLTIKVFCYNNDEVISDEFNMDGTINYPPAIQVDGTHERYDDNKIISDGKNTLD